MDDHLARRQQITPFVAEAETVGAHVALDHLHPAGNQFVEGFAAAQFGAEAVEAVVLEDLPGGALGDVAHATSPDQQDQFTVGDRAQQALHQGGAQEARRAGDGDALPGEVVGDHEQVVYQMVESCACMVG